MIEEDKVTLARERAELVARLAEPLAHEERVRVQGELAIVNAKIKALNTTEAARLKAAADQRKVAGLAEAKANAQRAVARVQAKLSGSLPTDDDEKDEEDEDDDAGQTAAIDGWIDAVLLRHDVDFTRTRDGKLTINGPGVVGTLIAGIYAAARGQELPALPPAKGTKSRKR